MVNIRLIQQALQDSTQKEKVRNGTHNNSEFDLPSLQISCDILHNSLHSIHCQTHIRSFHKYKTDEPFFQKYDHSELYKPKSFHPANQSGH